MKHSEKHTGMIFLKWLITILILAVLYYFLLPPLNFRAIQFWQFLLYAILIIVVINLFDGLRTLFASFDLNESIFNHNPSGIKAFFGRLSRPFKAALLAVTCILLLFLIGVIIGQPLFNATRYRDLITVQDGNFSEDVAEISMSSIPVVDRDSAQRLGQRTLGEMSDLVSQFEIENYYTQINYQGGPVRVTPLTYGDPVKWLYNQSTGIPAYIMVDMVTQETTLVRLEEGIKYSPGEYFFRDLERHLRFHYPTKIFDNVSFEIDDNGTPYWIAPTISYRIGLWDGKDIGGAVLVNAVTGQCQYYDISQVPTWVDQVYFSNLVIEQMNYNGKYRSGFFNSFIGQRGVLKTTDGYNYIAINDDVYLYTGMTSVTGDQSNVGFVLVNLRTKETHYYEVPGAEEYSAMASAEGMVQNLKYKATFPLLLNISDRPTYFMSLKDDAGLVKMYAFVDVEQYQVVGTGSTVDEAKADYTTKLRNENVELTPSETNTLSGVIEDIHGVVIEGNTYYYFTLSGREEIFAAPISSYSALPFLKAGDPVSFTYTVSGDICEVASMKKP